MIWRSEHRQKTCSRMCNFTNEWSVKNYNLDIYQLKSANLPPGPKIPDTTNNMAARHGGDFFNSRKLKNGTVDYISKYFYKKFWLSYLSCSCPGCFWRFQWLSYNNVFILLIWLLPLQHWISLSWLGPEIQRSRRDNSEKWEKSLKLEMSSDRMMAKGLKMLNLK